MKKFIFLKNTLILTATAFILRTLGIVLRVYMSNTIGAEGMGLYQLIFSIYILASTFATAGVSTAVIRLVSEELASNNKAGVIKVLKKSIVICISLGLFATFAIFYNADSIGKYWLNDVKTIPALKILVFAFPFMSVSSCIKGYFIARRKVSVPSNAQLIEQVVRIALIFFLLKKFAPYGISASCIAIMTGDVISEAASCLFSYFSYLNDKNKLPHKFLQKNKDKFILFKFFSIALPIAGNKYVNTILHTIENLLVPNSLTAFTSSREAALAQFGMLKAMALPIMFFPSSFLSAISTLLIPEMSEAVILNQQKKIHDATKRIMHITLTASILIGGIFYIFSYEFGTLIYSSAEVGFMIKVLAPLVPFMYLESMVAGMLQGLNQQMHSLKYIIIDSVLRIIMVYFLVPLTGINGFLLVMTISNITTSCLNARRLLTVANVKVNWLQWVIKPLFAFLSASVFVFLLNKFVILPSIIYLVSGISIIILFYFPILFLLKGFSKKDLSLA